MGQQLLGDVEHSYENSSDWRFDGADTQWKDAHVCRLTVPVAPAHPPNEHHFSVMDRVSHTRDIQM